MNRDIGRIGTEEFDLLVVGAGVNGAAAAWDASARGLKTALIDQGDFGAATSAGCFKIVHGGLRYLQHLDLCRLRESVEEQRQVRIMAPHLVRPLPFLIPCYSSLMKRRVVLRLALSVYETLARKRNQGVQPSVTLPNHQVLSREECLSIAPELPTQGLEGGVVYYDVQMNNCDRLTFGVVTAAQRAGCAIANYLSLQKLHTENSESGALKIVAAEVRDETTSERFMVKARSYVNATGPWISSLAAHLGYAKPAPTQYSKGIQLVVPQITERCAFAIESRASDAAAVVSRGARSYFIQPWNGYSLVGTSDELVEEEPDNFSISAKDISRFLREVREAYPCEELSESSVLHAFGGLRPLAEDVNVDTQGESARVARKDVIIDHLKQPFGDIYLTNLLSMRGVKYTTFRLFAERVVDAVCDKLSKTQPCNTKGRLLPSAPTVDVPKYLGHLQQRFEDLDRNYIRYLVSNYGQASEHILELMREGHTQLLVEGRQCRMAELIYCLRNEMVVTLEDALVRRIPLAALGLPNPEVVHRCAMIVARELGWDDERIKLECASLSGGACDRMRV